MKDSPGRPDQGSELNRWGGASSFSRPHLSPCVPFLQVCDARRSAAFYRDVLGFYQEWEHRFESGLPLAVGLRRDDAQLVLTEHPESAFGALVYLYVDDVNALAHDITERGASLDLGPQDQPWGYREIHLTDPDGNKLRFGQKLAE